MKRRTQGLINLAQLLFAPLPAYLLSRHLLSGGQINTPGFFFGLKNATISVSSALSPFLLANLLLAFSLLLGWLASLLQGSTWLIDPYWTLVPPLLDAFYRKACNGSENHFFSSPRATAATVLLLLWSLRLTHSYFRRERWQLGAREDWRYAEMRSGCGRHWWWWQLVPVYSVQLFLLAGLALPSFALRCCSDPDSSGSSGSSGSCSSSSAGGWGCLCSCVSSSSASSSSLGGRLRGFFLFSRGGGTASAAASSSLSPPVAWHPLLDSLLVAAALSGLLWALVADSQLHVFVSAREEARKKGKSATVLDSGLWSLSRHPNYLGETVFHLSLAALAVSGRYFSAAARRDSSSPVISITVLWPLAGAALNTACLLAVTRMTEQRTAAAKGRKRAWEGYCSRVPCWVPRVGALVRALKPAPAAAARPRARRR